MIHVSGIAMSISKISCHFFTKSSRIVNIFKISFQGKSDLINYNWSTNNFNDQIFSIELEDELNVTSMINFLTNELYINVMNKETLISWLRLCNLHEITVDLFEDSCGINVESMINANYGRRYKILRVNILMESLWWIFYQINIKT